MKLGQDSIPRIERIKKNIFTEILQYNKEAAINKLNRQKLARDQSLHQFQEFNRLEQQAMQAEDERKRKSARMQRDQLRGEYDREIQQKHEKQAKEKQREKIFAELAVSYQQFQSERRVYDLERIYHRRKYQADVSSTPPRRIKTEADHQQDNMLALYPSNITRRLNGGDESTTNHHSSEIKQNRYNWQGHHHKYHDSLDNIAI